MSIFHFSATENEPEPSFLQMVENYFDKAAKHTNIRPDILEFYKKPDNLIKLNLTLTRGIIIFT